MPPTLSLMTLVGIFALAGITLLLWIVWGAFEDRPTRGVLAAFVPGYALWYGWTRFSHVPLASRFAARTWDRNVNFVSPPFDGPMHRGEAVRFEFEPPSSLLTWTGRVLDGSGTPFARAQIAVDVPRESSRERLTVTTTADGRFVVFPDRVHRRVDGPVRISHHAAGGVEQSCMASPRVIRVGVADFGDLTLVPSPIVVAGRFRFGSGRPRVVAFTVERFEVGRETNPQGQFERVSGLRIVTETDGRFVVYGDVEPARHRLTFRSRTYLPREPVEFELGARDVEIDIDFGASLAAFGRVPQPWPAGPSGVSAVLRRVGAGGVGVADVGAPWPAVNRYRADPEIGPYGVTFEWRAIEAGTYWMEFRVDGSHDPVWTIRDVAVPAPEGGDPRLRRIDLREHLSVVTLEVVPRTNDPQEAIRVLLSGPVAFPIPQPPNVEWFGRPFDGLQLTMVVPRRGAHLLIVSKEVPRELRDVREGQRFTLDPWPEVECAFAELRALPDGVRLLARLAADPDVVLPRYRLSQGPSGVLHALHPSSVWNAVENGTVRLPIGTTPRRLELSLRRNGTNSGPTVAHDTPPIAPGTERVDVRVTPEAWERALTEVQQPPARGRR